MVKPFDADSYFFGKNSGVYFSAPTESGDLQLKYFDGTSVSDAGQEIGEVPFFSFSDFDYVTAARSSKGVALSETGRNQPQRLVIRGIPSLALTLGWGSKGPYYGSEMRGSVFLPGEKYFLFNLPYCGNYKGQLLIDTATGKYQRLPADTRVYITLNTITHPHYTITGGGLTVN